MSSVVRAGCASAESAVTLTSAVASRSVVRSIGSSRDPFSRNGLRSRARIYSGGTAASNGRFDEVLLTLRGGAGLKTAEWHDLVMDVVADIGTPEIGNAGNRAPVPDHFFFGLTKVRIVRRNRTPTAQSDARGFADIGVADDVLQRAIDAVHVFPNLFQHEHMPGQIRLQRRADEMAQDHNVEGRGRMIG